MNLHDAPGCTANAQHIVRLAAYALVKGGLATAYGHCSMRLDDEHFLVCAAKPMSLIQPSDNGTVVPINGSLPEGVLGEVRIHQQIYRKRPDVRGVVRSMPPHVMTLSTAGVTPRRRHGFGSYFPARMPFWDSPLLIRNEDAAEGVADTLGEANAIVLRGNGVVVAADSLEQAVVLSWYLEDAARIEWQLLAAGLGDSPTMTNDQARARAVTAGGIFERMWQHLIQGYPDGADTALKEQS